MAQYRDAVHAAVRSMGVGEGRPVPARWQQLASSGGVPAHRGEEVDVLVGLDRLLADSMTHARLHRELQAHEPEWRVLQALYATPETVRGEAIDRLAALTRAPGGYCCRRVWIGCWASPALAQKYGTKTLDWDGNATPVSTLRNQKSKLRKELERLKESALRRVEEVLVGAGVIGG